MHEWMVTIKRGAGHKSRRITVFVTATRRWAAIQMARQSFYFQGRARIVEAREVSG